MKTIKLLLILATLTLGFSSCNKDEIEETTGNLIVYAEDIEGTALSGEIIYLYNNEADFNNVIYSDSKTSNSAGKVTFKNLNPGVYYVDCDFDNQLGGTTTITGKGSVSAGFETTITIFP